MANRDTLPQLLTIDQLAERLGVTTRHIRRLVAERRVPYLKVRKVRTVRPRRDRRLARRRPPAPCRRCHETVPQSRLRVTVRG
jgi:excisionase family DNA binding protein